jgi:phenylacetate-CoA ligase
MDDFRQFGRRFPKGFILYGYTSWVLEVVREMEKFRMDLPIRAVVVAGEHLTVSDRRYIERITKTKLFTLYASREVGFLGFECEFHNMHINEEWAFVEIVDDRGLPLPSGQEGRIVVTTFDNRVMPFIRYDIGDVGVISDMPCACDRKLRTITFLGRAAERIELEDGRVVSLLDIAYALGSYKDSVRQYQIIQTSKISFTIRIVPGPLFGSNKENLDSLMVRMLHPRVQLQWEFVESIVEAKSGKAVYFVRDFV